MPNRLRSALVLAALVGLSAAPAFSQVFVFHLRGDQEVPPVPSPASGGCMGVLDQIAGQLDLTCVHDVASATVMHVHRGAPGVNGPILFDLGDPVSPVTASWTGMAAGDVNDLINGDLYINVHTAGRPSGEIRGQILSRTVDLVSFSANGAQNVPPNGTGATASCSADLDGPATGLAVQCTHDVASAVGAHVHVAPFGVNGPTVFTFASASSPLSGVVPMTPLLVAQFAATFLYLDIHTPPVEDGPGGDIRGQIGQPPVGATTGILRIQKVTYPAGGTSFGFTDEVPGSPGTFSLDDGDTEVFSAVPPGAYTVTENDPTPAGYALTDVSCDDADSTGDFSARTATIGLAAGEVVTCVFSNVQVAATDSLFVFDLRGTHEVPPVPTTATGGCMGRFDAGASELALVCTHNVVGATIMHIHQGSVGVNGPIVFDLGVPTSPVQAVWSGMTPADVANLFAGNLYVNIHTAGRPSGEIRGQILARTIDAVSFTADGSQVVPPGASAATATCTADLDAPATGLAVNCTHDLPAPDAAHLHDAPAGQNGPQVFTFPSPASPLDAIAPMNPRLVADFEATFLYVDIHGVASSEDTAGDQIRGQIGQPPAITSGAIRVSVATVPAGGASFGFTADVPGGPATFSLDDGDTQEFLSVPAGTYVVTESDPSVAPGGFTLTDVACFDDDSGGDPFARRATVRLQPGEVVECTFTHLAVSPATDLFIFHLDGTQEVPPGASPARGGCAARLDAGAGQLAMVCTHDVVGATILHVHRGVTGANGPIVFDLGDPASPVEAVWTGMTPADVADLRAGNLYVNIHTSGRPGGEIRGQILPRTMDAFAFTATGGQQVPAVSSPAIGQCGADLADDAATLLVRCVHTVNGATAAHLHDAPAGENGPLVFDFPPASPFQGTVPMSPRLLADFAAGFLYVNIHSADFPDGEVRGQLIAGGSVGMVEIPTLGTWGLIVLAFALVPLAWRRLAAGG